MAQRVAGVYLETGTVDTSPPFRYPRDMPPQAMLFYPQGPRPEAVAAMVCQELGYRIVNDPAARFDIGMFWTTRTVRRPDAALARCAASEPVLNFGCRDIGKRKVARVGHSVFGYSLSIDPRTHRGVSVRKSNLNATHDGVVVRCPVRRVDRSCVYERVVDNRVGNRVEDLRVPVFGDAIPFVLVGRKPVARRFDCAIAPVLAETLDVLTAREVAGIRQFSRAMGLDYAELDVLRDRVDGRIFIVDANPTPWAPEVIPTRPFRAIDRLASAFDRLVRQTIAAGAATRARGACA